MTIRNSRSQHSHHLDLRKDTTMHRIELWLAEAHERQSLLRSRRDADRSTRSTARSLRRQFGESLIRLGQRIGGETATTPAWQG